MRFGDGNDLEIYHSAGNASYIRDVGTGNLNIDSTGGNINIRVNTNESAIVAKQDGAVELYYDAVKKFETTGVGASVTGDLTVSNNVQVVGVLTVGSSSVTINGDTNTISVGSGVTVHTTTVSVNQLEVAGLSTFSGIGTFQNDVFVNDSLNVAGDASIVGVLTVGSSSVTINGDTNTITVGSGVTIHTTTASFNQLEVVEIGRAHV